MKALRTVCLILLALIVWLGGVELGEWFSNSRPHKLVSTADAIVGRPLTPVSVAGVARRTARRW